MNLCKYKNMFGQVGKGIHKYRIFNIAYVDALGTIVIAYIVAKLTRLNPIYVILFAFALGILCHRIFCVRTTVDKLLFP